MFSRPRVLAVLTPFCLTMLVTIIIAKPTIATTIGHDLIERPYSNYGNYMHAFVAEVPSQFPQRLTEWAVYDHDDPGTYMTPLLLEETSTRVWTVRGIGTPRQSDGNGLQGWFPFDLVAGQDSFLNENYYFGWYDGDATTGTVTDGVPDWEYGGPGEIISVARYVGVVSVGDSYSQYSESAANRTYSVQFKVVPEPCAITLLLCGLLGLAMRNRRR